MSHADSIVMGPGVGQADAANVLLDQVVNACAATRQRLLLDADALNLLARSPRRLTDRVVLTPHPTEAARLLGISTPEVHSDRPGAAAAIAQRFGAICVLKGAGTVLAHPDGRLAICAAGNPGMAAAGMGDVLSGLGGGLMAQSDDAWSMACVATLLHAQAGDRIAARLGERAVTPSAVIDELGEMSA
ncbi:MAG: NAD(P)H-hydrate dehydratase [Ahniella sp.]|nr:NAD(P)H-hydrate dehydratase [Ahniella sp.]